MRAVCLGAPPEFQVSGLQRRDSSFFNQEDAQVILNVRGQKPIFFLAHLEQAFHGWAMRLSQRGASNGILGRQSNWSVPVAVEMKALEKSSHLPEVTPLETRMKSPPRFS